MSQSVTARTLCDTAPTLRRRSRRRRRACGCRVRRAPTAGRRGMVLLEVLVALLLLTTTGLAVLALQRQGAQTLAEARGRDRELQRAERLLTRLTLLDAADLDRRLGMHPLGAWLVHVSRPEPALYRIAVRDTTAPDRELLVTVVFRPSQAGAAGAAGAASPAAGTRP